jgi:sensor c-di-GMP phosphodiesterase-like protein
VSCIKIDKSFVQTIETDRDNSVVVKSIIDLGHNLGLNVVAEGVETANAKNLLRAFRCDEGQGFYFCRPIPADAMTKFLLNPPATVKERQLVGEITGSKLTTKIEGSTASLSSFQSINEKPTGVV